MRLVCNSVYHEFGGAEARGPGQETSAKPLSAIPVGKLISHSPQCPSFKPGSSYKLTGLLGSGRGGPILTCCTVGTEAPGGSEGRVSFIAGGARLGNGGGGPSASPVVDTHGRMTVPRTPTTSAKRRENPAGGCLYSIAGDPKQETPSPTCPELAVHRVCEQNAGWFPATCFGDHLICSIK